MHIYCLCPSQTNCPNVSTHRLFPQTCSWTCPSCMWMPICVCLCVSLTVNNKVVEVLVYFGITFLSKHMSENTCATKKLSVWLGDLRHLVQLLLQNSFYWKWLGAKQNYKEHLTISTYPQSLKRLLIADCLNIALYMVFLWLPAAAVP